jgi:ABC-2 type transport system permease protein
VTTMTAPATANTIDDHRARTTLWHVIRSEWTKIWSVRSTFWTLLTLVVVTIGFSTLIAWGESSHLDQLTPIQRAQLDVTNNAMAGLAFGQLAIAVLGALVITSEYSTGGIKATLTAVPNRIRVLLSKAIVFAVIAFIVGVITAFGAFFISMIFWNQKHLATSLGDPGVLRAVIGGGLYVLASGLFGFALGVLIRHTAGSITAAVGLLFVAPPLTGLLPGTWGDDINKYFTSNAGQHITEVVSVPGRMSPWTGYLVITIWWLVPLLVGGYLMKRRDA